MGVPKRLSKMVNPERNWQQDEKKEKQNTICVGHYYWQPNTNNVDKT